MSAMVRYAWERGVICSGDRRAGDACGGRDGHDRHADGDFALPEREQQHTDYRRGTGRTDSGYAELPARVENITIVFTAGDKGIVTFPWVFFLPDSGKLN